MRAYSGFGLKAITVLLASLMCVACGAKSGSQVATLVVMDARVWTGDPSRPWVEAVASKGDRLIAVGGNEEVGKLVGKETRVISAPGAMLVPGFIDSHVHFIWGGSSLASVQLRDARTPEEFVQRIAEFAKTLQPGEWILDGTWDHENWGGELPSRGWIDAVTPENPVWILRLDGHMGLANSLALKQAGLTRDTSDVTGGAIVRDAGGELTGVLKDNAMNLVGQAVPEASESQLDTQLAAASAYVAAQGVTTVHDMADPGWPAWASLAAYRRAHASGNLKTRIYALLPLSDWERVRDEVAQQGTGDDWLRIGGLKGFMDGSLGSHTAAFFDPFTDAPNDTGLLLTPPEQIESWVSGADAAGLHVAIHAIGDRAIRSLLDIYARTAEQHGSRDRRFRIEHAQHIHPDDIPRFAAQDVIASMQPYHAIDDGRWAEKVIGPERIKTTYAFRSLLDSGARLAFGSDWNVAPATPLEGIYAAVTRRTLDDANPGGWVPQQKITVQHALEAYTTQAAYASFEEGIKGSLEVGKLADFVLLDRDLTRVAPDQIRNAKVLTTVVGGKIVYPAE